MAQLSILQLDRVLIRPTTLFAELARHAPSTSGAFFRCALWLALCPPLFAYVGTVTFGWRLGVAPIELAPRIALSVSAAYFVLLLVGLFTSALVSRWMSSTYGAVPVGLEAYGPGPAPARRQVHGRLARAAYDGPALGRAALDHARLSVALRARGGCKRQHRAPAARVAQPRASVHGRGHRGRRGRARRAKPSSTR